MFLGFGFRSGFLDGLPNAQAAKVKIDKLNYFTMKSGSSKDSKNSAKANYEMGTYICKSLYMMRLIQNI